MASAPAMRGRLALLSLVLLRTCTAKVASGSATLPANSTVFLAKFCFGHNADSTVRSGRVNVTLRASDGRKVSLVQLLLLDDEPQSFVGPSRQWDALTCEEKVSHAKYAWNVTSENLTRPEGVSMDFKIGLHVKPRFFYLALAECGDGDGEPSIQWHAHFRNLDYGWAEELSAERHYSLVVLLVFTAVYGCLAVLQRYVNSTLAQSRGVDSASSKAAHPFARLLLAGITLAWGEAMVLTANNLVYVYNGRGAPFAVLLAQLLAVSSNFVLASLLLLISEGKCVSYNMVPADVRRKCRLLAPFLISCFVLELGSEYSVSQHYTTDYVYTTPCGWVLIAADLWLLCTYTRNLRRTYAIERVQREGAFYRTWGVVYASWFLVLPVAAVLAQALLAPYAWYMVCTSLKKGVTALAFASLVAGLWPGNVGTYFKLEELPVLLRHGAGRFAAEPALSSLHPCGCACVV